MALADGRTGSMPSGNWAWNVSGSVGRSHDRFGQSALIRSASGLGRVIRGDAALPAKIASVGNRLSRENGAMYDVTFICPPSTTTSVSLRQPKPVPG